MTREDKDLEAGLPLEPSPTYQVPDWEGTVKPPLSQKHSILHKIVDGTKSIKAVAATANAPHFSCNGASTHPSPSSSSLGARREEEKKDKALEASGIISEGTFAPWRQHTFSLRAGTTKKATAVMVGGALAGVKAKCAKGLDRAVPPNRTYLGLSRKFFLLAVVLPLAVIFFLILPLGLGIGLGRKKNQNLPLPTSGDIFTGDLTYYSPGLGACGYTNDDSDAIVAVSRLLWDAVQVGSNPNTNLLCGKKIRVQRDFVEQGKGLVSVDVTVVDRCVGCEADDLDLTIAMFTKLANEAQGRVVGSWAWLDSN